MGLVIVGVLAFFYFTDPNYGENWQQLKGILNDTFGGMPGSGGGSASANHRGINGSSGSGDLGSSSFLATGTGTGGAHSTTKVK